MCAMRDLQREGGVFLGVSATGNRRQHKGKGKRLGRRVGCTWACEREVLRYAALLIGATLSRTHRQFIRYNKHFASCSAATGTRNGQHGQSDML